MALLTAPHRPNCETPDACRAKGQIIGARFGRLRVIEELPPRLSGARPTRLRRVLCLCDCGVVKAFDIGNLRSRRRPTSSCGCYRRSGEWATPHPTHGERIGGGRSPEYLSWRGMISRCENAHHADFKHWGARGIRVCARWRHDFAAFLEDMGRKPTSRHSIDRIDVNGHYEPDNCRWATPQEQRANQRPRKVSNAH